MRKEGYLEILKYNIKTSTKMLRLEEQMGLQVDNN